jgi:hypothetical protein
MAWSASAGGWKGADEDQGGKVGPQTESAIPHLEQARLPRLQHPQPATRPQP